MVNLLTIFFIVAWSACAAAPEPTPAIDIFPGGCVIACVEFQANLSLQRHGVWSRVVRLGFDGPGFDHAIVVFSLANGEIARYDVNVPGTTKLGIIQRDLPSIAAALKYQYPRMIYAVWFD